MDTFENQDQLQEETGAVPEAEGAVIPEEPLDHSSEEASASRPAPEEAPRPTEADGTGTGRKESPYADSPYEIQRQPEYQYRPQTERPPKKEKTPKTHTPGKRRRAVAVLLILALAAVSCLTTAHCVNSRWERENAETLETVNALNERISVLEAQAKTPAASGGAAVSRPAKGSGLTPSQLYAENVDSVVAVSCSVGVPGYYGISEGTSLGSGFILREDGYVATNSHIVKDATAVTVTLGDGTEYDAQVVGMDASFSDIAVLKIEAEGLHAVTLGSSADLQVGDMVVAIGNHLGTLTASQTVGYLSGIDREISTESSRNIRMLQTDAAINSGSSGGPLFNMRGEVIGITTAKYSGSAGSGASIEGISFAIPIDDVREILTDLADFGYVTGAYLGVTVQDMDPDTADMYGLPVGAYVVTVADGGSADRAGVKPKDIIVRLGEYETDSITELTRNLRHFKAGDETTITVVRGGREMVLDITLDERPRDLDSASDYGYEEPEMPDSGDYDEWYDYFSWYFGE